MHQNIERDNFIVVHKRRIGRADMGQYKIDQKETFGL